MSGLRRMVAALLAAGLAGAGPARAQEPKPAPSAQEEGRGHFQRGVEFFKEGDYRAALAEFKRSYETAPSYRILYNIGQANNGLQDYAGALRAFERYLAEGGAEIDAERRAQVQAEIRRLRARVAFVEIEVNVPGAEIFVDDVSVGLSPLESPVLVSAGVRKIGAVKPPSPPASRVVELVGGDKKRVALALASPEPGPRPAPGPRADQADASGGPSRVPFWVALAATGALGVGTAVTGVLALQERRSLDDAFEGTDDEAIDDARARARAFAVTADVLGAATLLAGGVTLYFALRPSPKSPAPSASARSLELGLKPGGASLRLSF
ncbi:MAG TPA: tetratricopeptide repeat protein [Polyangiaceae bacterium]|nr:tetratricopeptide repeat protein [Polyangiaceae bacterium]